MYVCMYVLTSPPEITEPNSTKFCMPPRCYISYSSSISYSSVATYGSTTILKEPCFSYIACLITARAHFELQHIPLLYYSVYSIEELNRQVGMNI